MLNEHLSCFGLGKIYLQSEVLTDITAEGSWKAIQLENAPSPHPKILAHV